MLVTEGMPVDIDIRGEVKGQLQTPGDLYPEVTARFAFCPM
jgi:hypothetical protein